MNKIKPLLNEIIGSLQVVILMIVWAFIILSLSLLVVEIFHEAGYHLTAFEVTIVTIILLYNKYGQRGE